MSFNENDKLKIRFKFPSGEEFEAEGPREFIEEQRAYFLGLTGKTPKITPHRPAAPQEPRRRPTYPLEPAAPAAAQTPTEPVSPAVLPVPSPPSPLWDRLFKTEDGVLVFRRKSRLLTPQTAALVLIAAAKNLRKDAEYSALHLSKSLRKSGYGEGRLDRLLLAELRAGSIVSVGSKRGRSYRLSGEGLTRAVLLAERLETDG